MKFILLLTLALTAQCSFGAYEVADSSNFSWEKMKSLIEIKNSRSVEDALKEIKAYYPEFFKNYILMYHSRSLQGSSFENPRALLFDRSGQIVFSFNGNSKQRGFDRLEVMQFRADQNRFEFREVIFSAKGAPTFSDPNPAKCMVCHQDVYRKNIDPRPNWEPYNIWPGAFGSNSGDLTTNKFEFSSPRFQRMDAEMHENMKREEKELEKFFSEVQPNHDRYQLLEPKSYNPHFTVDFTTMMNSLNFRRVSRIITEEWAEVYKYLEPAVWGVIRCGKLLVSNETYEWIKSNWPKPEYLRTNKMSGTTFSYEIYLKKPPIKTKQQILMEQKGHRVGNELDNISEVDLEKIAEATYQRQFEIQKDYHSIDLSRGLHHLFEPLGISTADWSMNFRTDGRLAFRERFGDPSDPRRLFYNAFRKVNGEPPANLSCKDLGKQAEEKFELLKKSALFTELMARKEDNQKQANAPIINRCVKCHSTDKDPSIPSISFNDPEQLAKELNMSALYSPRKLIDEVKYRLGDYAKESERMPMGPIATKQQRQELIDYLENLAEGNVSE